MMLQATIKDTNRTALDILYSICSVLAPEAMTALHWRGLCDTVCGGAVHFDNAEKSKERFAGMVKRKRRLQKGAALALSFSLLLGSLAGCGDKPQEDTSGADGPANTYMPSVNKDGQIVITMPKTLLGGKTAEELEAEDKEQRQAAAQDGTLEQAVYNGLAANEDGTFSYYLTKEQYPKLKAAYYWLGCLRDAYTNEISQEFVTEADYTDIDENGVPWGLTVSVDAETYHSMEMWYSALVTVAPAVMLGRYQVLCGVPGDEWAVHVTVKDTDSGEVISEHDFPTRDE